MLAVIVAIDGHALSVVPPIRMLVASLSMVFAVAGFQDRRKRLASGFLILIAQRRLLRLYHVVDDHDDGVVRGVVRCVLGYFREDARRIGRRSSKVHANRPT
ncbi:MAG: hypothetical protein MP439_01850 [Ferrimicrobium sp.]|nr:hypothetical protein [Ferrimicrobium sp.]